MTVKIGMWLLCMQTYHRYSVQGYNVLSRLSLWALGDAYHITSRVYLLMLHLGLFFFAGPTTDMCWLHQMITVYVDYIVADGHILHIRILILCVEHCEQHILPHQIVTAAGRLFCSHVAAQCWTGVLWRMHLYRFLKLFWLF